VIGRRIFAEILIAMDNDWKDCETNCIYAWWWTRL